MPQQGQLIRLKRRGRDGEPLWAYRYRMAGRGSKRVQRGGFASDRDAAEAMERELERLRRERRLSKSLTLAELVDVYLAQHDVEPVTIEKLRWLLGKAVAVFGERPVAGLRSEEIAAWRIALSPGYRFDATQALRQVLARAVVWGMIDANPAKLGVDNPSPRRREQRPFDSWAELDAIAANLSPRYRPMVIFAAATGLRPAEWLALEWRDIDLEAGGLCPPLLHKGSAEVPEDRDEPPSRADADDRARSDRTAAIESAQRTRVPCPARRLPRPAQLPKPRMEAGAIRGWDRAHAQDLRSPTHLRHLRAPCRHLHLRPLPLHGRQPDHDRPPLRPPRQRRTRTRDPPAGRVERGRTSTVDAAWTPKATTSASRDNGSIA
jgi:integrase